MYLSVCWAACKLDNLTIKAGQPKMCFQKQQNKWRVNSKEKKGEFAQSPISITVIFFLFTKGANPTSQFYIASYFMFELLKKTSIQVYFELKHIFSSTMIAQGYNHCYKYK